jgi:poly(A) polymerase
MTNEESGLKFYESSFTALDAYHGVGPAPIRFVLAEGSLVDLARSGEKLDYPGLSYADAAIGSSASSLGRVSGEGEKPPTYIRLVDTLAEAEGAAFAVLDLLRDPAGRGLFHDPKGIYPLLREKDLEPRPAPAEDSLFEAAGLLSRYDYELPRTWAPQVPRDFPQGAQRDLLVLILTGKTPERGFEFLKERGFIEAYWPELGELFGVDQSKDFHPEGDVWAHTMETFRHRKLPELRLSLALLLHDSGKPRASSAGGRRFDRHAELGSGVAERFLRRLGFPPGLIADVSYLVRYHMLPAALPRLPLEKGIEGVDEPLFPLLLELYKCDELSSFKGPEGYYEACAAYRSHLKNNRNPWRNPEAQRLARIYVEGRQA